MLLCIYGQPLAASRGRRQANTNISLPLPLGTPHNMSTGWIFRTHIEYVHTVRKVRGVMGLNRCPFPRWFLDCFGSLAISCN